MKRELDRGVESQKQAQIEKMKQALAALSVVAAKKQKALHVQLSERSSRLEQLVKEKNAREASRNELRGELKNMRVGAWTGAEA